MGRACAGVSLRHPLSLPLTRDAAALPSGGRSHMPHGKKRHGLGAARQPAEAARGRSAGLIGWRRLARHRVPRREGGWSCAGRSAGREARARYRPSELVSVAGARALRPVRRVHAA